MSTAHLGSEELAARRAQEVRKILEASEHVERMLADMSRAPQYGFQEFPIRNENTDGSCRCCSAHHRRLLRAPPAPPAPGFRV